MTTNWPWLIIVIGLLVLVVSHVSAEDNETSSGNDRVPAPRNGVNTFRSWSGEVMQIVVSAAVLAAALYVILTPEKFGDDQAKWAFGSLGTILGFWLRR